MMKFFRKYNKTMLAIVTGLLMIVFLGGSALTALVSPSPNSAVIAEAYGKSITQGDQARITMETNILSQMGIPWNRPWGWDFQLPPLSEIDYMLLIEEARRNGATPNLDRSEAMLANVGRDLTDFTLRMKISTQQLKQAVANYGMVADTWEALQRVARSSELDLNKAVRDRYQKVRSKLVAISAEPFRNDDEAIPDSDLQAQFDTYKDRLRGAGTMDFGYRVPEKVRLQYIAIDSSKIEMQTTITARMAERYWSENKTEFLKPAEAEDEVDDTAEDEEPGSPYYETFEEAKADVMLAMGRLEQLDQARLLAQTLRSHLAESWYTQQTGEDNYPETPEGVDDINYYQATFDKLRDSLPGADSISIETTDLVTREQAAELAGLGSSREDLEAAAGARWFRSLSHNVQGLFERTQNQTADDSLALYQTCQVPMIDDDNRLYLYRVVETAEARPPADLAEVREQVLADVRVQRAFDRASAEAQKFLDQYDGSNLVEAWEAYTGIDAELKTAATSAYETSAFARTTGTPRPVAVRDIDIMKQEHLIQSQAFVDAAYDLLESAGDKAHGKIEVPEIEKCFVIQLDGQLLLTPADFSRYRGQIEALVMRDRLDQLKREWFNSDSIQSRTKFSFVSADG